jgi:hypothetical protein
MDLPRVKKRLWDLIPAAQKITGRSKQIGTGFLVVAMGTFASPAQPAVPGNEPPGLSVQKDQSAGKLILQQPSAPSSVHAQHWSHSSHYSHSSHASHSSHYSHYSSR